MPKISLAFLKAYLLIIVSTASQMFILRWLLHSVFRLQIGWVGMTDFDVAIPMAISLFISLLVLGHSNEIELKLQKTVLYCNLILSFGFLALSYHISTVGDFSSFNYFLWVLLLLSVFLSSLCIWISPSHFVANNNSWVLFPAILLSTSVIVYQHFYSVLWPSLIPMTGKATCMVLKPFLGSSFKCTMNSSMVMFLREKYFWADIAAGCSGLDGQLFFIISFLILFSLYGKKVGLFQWVGFLFLGPILLFWVNVFRIVAFYLIGVITARTTYYEFGINTMLFLFHAHAGWILYSVSIYFLQNFVLVREYSWKNRKALKGAQ